MANNKTINVLLICTGEFGFDDTDFDPDMPPLVDCLTGELSVDVPTVHTIRKNMFQSLQTVNNAKSIVYDTMDPSYFPFNLHKDGLTDEYKKIQDLNNSVAKSLGLTSIQYRNHYSILTDDMDGSFSGKYDVVVDCCGYDTVYAKQSVDKISDSLRDGGFMMYNCGGQPLLNGFTYFITLFKPKSVDKLFIYLKINQKC